MKLSAVVITKNEQENIKDCLNSLNYCDEKIIVDDNSQDKTKNIAKNLGAKIFTRDIKKNISSQLNFGMEKAKGDWILFLDADERVGEGLAQEILCSIKNDKFSGFFIRRIDILWGKEMKGGETSVYKSLRLVKKGSGKWKRRVHQQFELNGRAGTLTSPLLHYPHKTIKEFVKSIDRWSSWHALANKEEGKRSTLLKIILWPKLHFIKNYILRFGFRDKTTGFITAVLMSMHSFFAWSKLWLMQRKN